jgi:hypothetical protein
MKRTCQRCGRGFEGVSTRATYCSGACKVAAHRAKGRGEVVDLPRPPVSDRRPATSLVASVRSELADLDAAGSPEGLALMALAERIDMREDSAAALAAAVREFRAQLGSVRASHSRPEPDILDDLASRRADSGA